MHRARAFFYVCAGLFLLALSYHLGARSATAQGGMLVEAADVNGPITAVSGRMLYYHGGVQTTVAPSAIPGSSPVVAAGSVSYNSPQQAVAAVLENGDVYEAPDGPVEGFGDVGSWSYAGSLFGATPAQRETFGAMKSRYRGERGPTQGR